MKWNEIREKVKKPIGSMGAEMKKTVISNVSTSNRSDIHRDSKKTTRIILIAVIVLAIIVGAWLLQLKKKVANLGPAVDAGITRQEARDAQSFLEQIPLQPLTTEEINMITESSKSVETKNPVPATNSTLNGKQTSNKTN